MKKIGILASQMASNSKVYMYGVYLNYSKLFAQYGKVYMVMPHQDPDDMDIDLLVLPGGPDLSTAIVSEPEDKNFRFGTGKDMPTFTSFFENKMELWVEAAVPIFGICLGMQQINNFFGGDISADMFGHNLRDTHRSLLLPNADIHAGVNPGIIGVNSRHHQAIRYDVDENHLASCLKPLVIGMESDSILEGTKKRSAYQIAKMLVAEHLKSDKIPYGYCNIEAFIHRYLPIAGVQWHPEDLTVGNYRHGDYITHNIISHLLDAPSKGVMAAVGVNGGNDPDETGACLVN